MDEDLWGILFLLIFFGCVSLLFFGAKSARKGKDFWAVRLVFSGSILMFVSAIVIGLFALASIFSSEYLGGPEVIAVIFYFVLLLGILLYLIGFIGFCARWGATGKRRAELLEITAALSAARDQAQREFDEQTPSSHPST